MRVACGCCDVVDVVNVVNVVNVVDVVDDVHLVVALCDAAMQVDGHIQLWDSRAASCPVIVFQHQVAP